MSCEIEMSADEDVTHTFFFFTLSLCGALTLENALLYEMCIVICAGEKCVCASGLV